MINDKRLMISRCCQHEIRNAPCKKTDSEVWAVISVLTAGVHQRLVLFNASWANNH